LLKKLGTVVVTTAAGMVMLGGMASASDVDCGAACRTDDTVGQDSSRDQGKHRQVGLVNVNNTSVAENVNVLGAVCDNNISVLGVQVPIEDVANGINVPVGSPSHTESVSASPDFCSMSGIIDQ
jgi:hypothetical protein